MYWLCACNLRFCGRLSIPNILKPMDWSINPRFKSSTKLLILTCTGGFRSCDPQHTIRKKVFPIFSYSDRTNARMFVNRDQAARHKYTIGRPGCVLIGYTINKSFNTSMKYFSVLPEFENQPLQSFQFRNSGPELPKSFHTNKLTTSSVISTGIKIGVFLYVSNI